MYEPWAYNLYTKKSPPFQVNVCRYYLLIKRIHTAAIEKKKPHHIPAPVDEVFP